MNFVIPGIIGLVAGVLGGLLGIGGSLIIIPALILYLSYTAAGYRGDDQHLLQAAAMIVNVFVAAPSVLAHWKAGAIMRSVVTWLIPSAVVGIVTGVALSNSSVFARENGAYLAMILCGFLVYVMIYNAHRMFRPPLLAEGEAPPPAAPARVICAGLVMGVFAGLLGVGGGAICVPIQQIALKIPLRRAIANSAATIPFASLIGAVHKNLTLADHGVAITDSLLLAAMLIPTAVVGSYFGGRLTHVLPRRVLRVIFILFLATVTILTFTKARKALDRSQALSAPARQAAPAPETI
ncbi:MAG: sulfite exporter TauE/SafE family protein [Planctomycetaceae bacterium]|nr:sulfite exporter TauE/SafE family protein [Planctomycetaceae bacterium]